MWAPGVGWNLNIQSVGKDEGNEHSKNEKPEVKEISEVTTLSNNSCSREVHLQVLIVYIKKII